MRNTAEHPAVRTVFAPYDSGYRGLRMGAGPGYLMDNRLPQMLPPPVSAEMAQSGGDAGAVVAASCAGDTQGHARGIETLRHKTRSLVLLVLGPTQDWYAGARAA